MNTIIGLVGNSIGCLIGLGPILLVLIIAALVCSGGI